MEHCPFEACQGLTVFLVLKKILIRDKATGQIQRFYKRKGGECQQRGYCQSAFGSDRKTTAAGA